jgi:hypothetical protein
LSLNKGNGILDNLPIVLTMRGFWHESPVVELLDESQQFRTSLDTTQTLVF